MSITSRICSLAYISGLLLLLVYLYVLCTSQHERVALSPACRPVTSPCVSSKSTSNLLWLLRFAKLVSSPKLKFWMSQCGPLWSFCSRHVGGRPRLELEYHDLLSLFEFIDSAYGSTSTMVGAGSEGSTKRTTNSDASLGTRKKKEEEKPKKRI